MHNELAIYFILSAFLFVSPAETGIKLILLLQTMYGLLKLFVIYRYISCYNGLDMLRDIELC